MKAVIVDLQVDKNVAVRRMIAVYIGESCRYCNHVYESVEDISERKVVFAGPYMLACKSCFDANNPANTAVSGKE